jgi:hypothetical protein
MTRWMRCLVQIVIDGVLVASLIWIVLYVFSDQPPPGVLFGIVLMYALVIAAPAHLILGRVFPLGWGGPLVQWTIFVLLLGAIAMAGSLVGTLLVLALRLETGMGFGTLLSVSMRLRSCWRCSSASCRRCCSGSGIGCTRPRRGCTRRRSRTSGP